MNRRTAIQSVVGALSALMLTKPTSGGEIEYRDGVTLTPPHAGDPVQVATVDWVRWRDGTIVSLLHWDMEEGKPPCSEFTVISPITHKRWTPVVLARGGWWGPKWE